MAQRSETHTERIKMNEVIFSKSEMNGIHIQLKYTILVKRMKGGKVLAC